MPIETVGVRAVVEKLDQYLAGVNNMNTRTDQLITTVERLAASSAKTNALLNQTAQAYQRKATASTQAKKADEEHVSVLQKIENQLKRNLSASVQFSGAFLIIKAQQAIFEGLSEAIVGMNARLEQASIAFTTMLGSAKGAASFLSELQQFAARTPFEFPELVAATQRLLAFQIEARKVIPLLTAIGDAVAGLGSGAQGIERVTLALGQMSAKGKVSGEELRQLAEAGIPGLKILAEELKLTTAEVQDLVSQGAVSSDTFLKAFQKFSELNFGGLMQKQEQTFLGSLSTIKDQLLILSSEGFKPLFDAIRNSSVAFASFLKSDEAVNTAKDLAAVFKIIADNASFLVPVLTAVAARFAVLAVVGAVSWAFKAIPVLINLSFAFQAVAARAATAGEAMQLLGAQSVKGLGPIGLLVIAFTALDIAINAITGRGLTERILGIGKAATSADDEIKRLHDRLESLTEAGVPRAEAQGIVNKDAAEQLDQFAQKLTEVQSKIDVIAVKSAGTSGTAFGAIIQLGQALDFIDDPLKTAQGDVKKLSDEFINNTKTAEELRQAYLAFPNLEPLLGAEFAKRSAAELKNLVADQRAAAEFAPGFAARTGSSFQQLDEFIQHSSDTGKEWAKDLQTAIAATEGKVTPDLKKLSNAFSTFFESDQSRESLQKFLETAFTGGKNNALAKFFEQLTKDAENGRKNVLSALKDLIPGTDELFSEWLARLETHGKNLANFSNNLRFVFSVLSKAGVEGAGEFIRVLEQAGPNVTAGVAGMIAINPQATIDRLKPTFDILGKSYSGSLSDSIIDGLATTQESVANSTSKVINAGLIQASGMIDAGFRAIQARFRAGILQSTSDINEAVLLGNAQFANLADFGQKPQVKEPAPGVVNPTPSETPGALDRLADEADKAARKAEQEAEKARRDAEKAQREAEQAARDVAQAFEAELEIRLRTVAQATSEDFSRFFNLFVAGFTTQAAEVFDRLPESVQRLTVQLTLAEQAERQFNDSLFELQNFQNISVFGTITNQILDFQSVLDGFFSKIEKSSRAAQQVGGFQKLGQLAAQAYATGLINASGAAGEAAKRIVEAVKAEFEASVKVFDNLANAIVDAIKKRNQKEEDAQLDALNKSKDAFKDETEAKKKAIDDQLQARLDGLDAEKSALKDFTDAAKKQIEAEKDARIEALDAAKRTADNAPAPDFSTTGSEKAINAQAQAFVDASNARIAALQREKQAIDDLAAARDQDKKIQEAQAKIDTLNRVLQGGVSAGARRFLVRQIKEQQKTIDEAQTQRQQKAADDAAKKAIDDKIAAEQALQKQRQDAAQAEIEHVKAIAEAQKKFYEDQKKANDQSIENEKKRIEKKAQAEKDAIEAAAKAEEKKIKDQEEAERKAAAARKDQLDKDLKDTTTNIDNNIAAIRKFFDEVVNSSANINQQVLDLIQGGKVGEIAQLFTDAGITPFQLSGLTLGQAFFTGFFNKDQSLDATVTANIAAIRTGAANTEAILSGGALSTSLTDGATAALPAGFDTMTNSTIAELDSLRDQANPVATDHGTEVGISFVDGMINGVTVRTPALEQAIRDAVAKGVAAAQATIQSHSPSRVTERLVGLPFSQGIAVGILRGGRDIERAAQQVVRIAPGIGQPGGALVASPSMVQAQGMATSMAALANGGGVAQAPVVQEIHNHNWTIQAWDSTDVRRNMSKILREFDQGARRGKTGPIGG